MKFVGIDLHKHVIRLCVMQVVHGKREIVARRRFVCRNTEAIREYFEGLGRFQAVVEATASYEWFFLLIEDLADRLVLAHPKKLRVIAESTRKTDRIDAEVLAVFLALDMIPEAYRPSPRIRQYRVLVRHRRWVSRRITAAKAKLRNKLAHYNADIAGLFTRQGKGYLAEVAMGTADRFESDALWAELELLERQLAKADTELLKFAESAPLAEREARSILASIPRVGPVTIDVVLSELGDWRRFRGARAVVDFAGLAPGIRESAGRRRQLSITKEGSRLLRWALIQAAWRLATYSPRWQRLYQRLERNTGSKKKAIVGVARQLLCVMF
jgi:transposase